MDQNVNRKRAGLLIIAEIAILILSVAIYFLLTSRNATPTDPVGPNKGGAVDIARSAPLAEAASRARVPVESAPAQSRPRIAAATSKPAGGMRSWDRRTPQKLIVKVLDSQENACAGLTVKIGPNTRDPDIRFQARPMQAVTNADGKAVFDDWPIGFGVKVEVDPNKEKKLYFKERSVYPSSVAPEFEIVMKAGAVGGLRGQLRMRSTATPVAGAVEAMVDKMSRPLQTDAIGVFEYTALLAGDWTLKAGTADSQLFESPFTIRVGETTDLGWIDLDEVVWLAGIVVDENGKPLEGIQLSGPSRPAELFPTIDIKKRTLTNATSTVTDAAGAFRLPAAKSGATSFISAFDKRPRSAVVSKSPYPPGVGVSQRFGPFTAPDENLKLVFENQPEIIVELIDPLSGNLITTGQMQGYCMKNGKMIRIGSFHNVDESDSKFHILVIPTDELVLEADTGGRGEFGLTVKKFTVPKGQAVVNLQMFAELNLVVKLKVVDSEGNPLFFFPIRCKFGAEGLASKTTLNTDFDGNIKFTNVGRTLIFEVNEEGFEPWTQAVTNPSRNDIDLGTIILKRK